MALHPSSSSESPSAASGSVRLVHPTARPNIIRGDTDRILSYYQSTDADKGSRLDKEPQHRPRPSRDDSTSSEYSVDDDLPPVNHRREAPLDGNSDRRRLHILQVAQQNERSGSDNGHLPASANLRSRRGIETDLALVAPPDASPETYTRLTPPLTAVPRMHNASTTYDPHQHQRSTSEAVSPSPAVKHKSSREISIIGTNLATPNHPLRQLTPNTQLQPPFFQSPQSRSPSPGTVSSHSYPGRYSVPAVGPLPTPEVGQGKEVHEHVAPPVTVRLTSVQMNDVSGVSSMPSPPFSPTLPFSPVIPSSYLHYQPGVHAIAGPLPPPPRAAFAVDPSTPPPPRPPRLHSPPPSAGPKRRGDLDAVKHALQLPPSVEKALNQKKSRGSMRVEPPVEEEKRELSVAEPSESGSNTSVTSESVSGHHHHPIHVREGAFPPSTICPRTPSPPPQVETVPFPSLPSPAQTIVSSKPRTKMSMDDLVADVGHAIDAMGIIRASDVPPPTVVEPPRAKEEHGRPALEVRRRDSWVDEEKEASFGECGRISSDFESDRPAVIRVASHPASGPEKENDTTNSRNSSPPKGFKETFVNLNIKRLSSLSRKSSLMSLNRLSGSSRSTRTPSPASFQFSPVVPPQVPRVREKIRTRWPSAMACGDVLAKRSAADRSVGYAMKINELWMCDCGLGEWVVETRYRGSSPSKRATLPPSGPSTIQFQPRHVSRSSMISEITFPKRSDAYTATDLSSKSHEDYSPPNAPPPLPYPSLAVAPVLSSRNALSRTSTVLSPSTSTRTLQSPTSGKSGGGFFASLGRKTSVRREKQAPANALSPSSETPRRVLSKPQPAPSPAPRPVNISNSPSVPGGPRAPPNRMQRSQTVIISSPPSGATGSHRSSTMAIRRPNVFNPATPAPISTVERDPEFVRQVDRLADLLPHADKNVLAGYLRRAGQDILAIGQYLEDEKNGTIRRD